jgi:hypothetical protein
MDDTMLLNSNFFGYRLIFREKVVRSSGYEVSFKDRYYRKSDFSS